MNELTGLGSFNSAGVAEMSISELRNARTQYPMDVTLEKLRFYLEAVNGTNAMELLEKTINKAQTDKIFATRFEDAVMHGSTIEFRALFEAFGCYWSKTSEEIPYYPHHDAVNMIDTAMFHIRIGDDQQAIDDYNFLHNRLND
jgi:hypothetical protein